MSLRSEILIVAMFLLLSAGCSPALQLADLRAAAAAALATCRNPGSCPDPQACVDAAAEALKTGAGRSSLQTAATRCWPYLP